MTKVVSQSLFPNKRCSISCPSVLAQKTAKYEKLFFRFVSLILRSNRWFYNLFLKRCSKACICGNKPNQTKNRRSYFCLAVLITWCRTAFSQPLDKRCSKASFSVLSQIYAKMWKATFTKFFLILETKRLFHNLLINGVQKPVSRY